MTAKIEKKILSVIVSLTSKPIDWSLINDEVKNFLNDANHSKSLAIELQQDLEYLERFLNLLENNNFNYIEFDDFNPFKGHIEALTILHESKIDFKFKNYEGLDRNFLPDLINYFIIEKEIHGDKIKRALEKRRKSGKELGNANIGDEKGKAIARRKFNAFLNDHNINLRREILKLKTEANISYRRIAESLNARNLFTINDKKHSSKSIQRLFDATNEIVDRFAEKGKHALLDVNDNISEAHCKTVELIGIKEGVNFDHQIEFTIKSSEAFEFDVFISDNDNNYNKPIFEGTFNTNDGKTIINLQEHALLPGRYYISIFPKDESICDIANIIPIFLWKGVIGEEMELLEQVAK